MSRQPFKRVLKLLTPAMMGFSVLCGSFQLLLSTSSLWACEVILPSGERFQPQGASCSRPRKVLWQQEHAPLAKPMQCARCCLVRYPGYQPMQTPWILLWHPQEDQCHWVQATTMRVVTTPNFVQKWYQKHLEATWDVTQYMTFSGNARRIKPESPEITLESLFGD